LFIYWENTVDRYKLKLFIAALCFVAIVVGASVGFLLLAAVGEVKFTYHVLVQLCFGWAGALLVVWYAGSVLCLSTQEHIAGAARTARKIRELSSRPPRT